MNGTATYTVAGTGYVGRHRISFSPDKGRDCGPSVIKRGSWTAKVVVVPYAVTDTSVIFLTLK